MSARSLFFNLRRTITTTTNTNTKSNFNFNSYFKTFSSTSDALNSETEILESEDYSHHHPQLPDDLKSRLFRLRHPKRSATNILQKWVNEGNSVNLNELRQIYRDLRKSQRYKHALEITEWMVSHDEYKLSDSDYAARLDLMTKVFGIDAAERYFEGLPDDAKTNETYTALLHSYASAKFVDKAEELFQRINDSGISFSAITYNEMMTLYMSVGQAEKVSSVIDELKLQNVAPDLYTYKLQKGLLYLSGFPSVLPKVLVQNSSFRPLRQGSSIASHQCFHSSLFLTKPRNSDTSKQSESGPTPQDVSTKVKRKKLKGKRAVVRWLKHFRYKKKKELERMTAEEKLLYKLNKARKKEERLLEALKKLEPKEWSEATHDPEVLTPEEHFYFLKMGLKCKNYVPVGRRGIYQGVILNMHLHWKKHQTLQVIVKTFTPEEVKEMAAELARLTGGIVLDIHDENTIIMYRGKNYAQPPTEIMSPRSTLPRKKALDKSRYRDSLRAVRKYIPRLEQEIELLRAQIRNKEYDASELAENATNMSSDPREICSAALSSSELAPSDKLREVMDQYEKIVGDDDPFSDASMNSDSEDLSDIFETDLDSAENLEQPLYLKEFDKFPAMNSENFEEDLRQMSLDSKEDELLSEGADLAEFDEVDQIFLRAAELLKKKKQKKRL